MEEKGVITKVEEKYVRVKIERHSACSKCDRQCGLAVDSEKEETIVNIKRQKGDDFSLQTGQQVVLEMEEKSLIFSALLIYIFPLLVMIAGYFLLERIYQREAWGIIGALIGLATGFGLVKLVDMKFKQTGQLEPRIKRIITNHGGVNEFE